MKLELQPLRAGEPATWAEWDDDAGIFTGPGADQVRALIDAAVGRGYVIGHPYPTTFEIRAPATDPAELAVVLGSAWRVPAPLADLYPAPPDEEPAAVGIDGDGNEHPFQVVE